MHYPWYGFITEEAAALNLSTMTDRFTGVPVQKPRQVRITGKDAMQLQRMYNKYCPPLDVGICANGDPYLIAQKCDGHGDCSFFQA